MAFPNFDLDFYFSANLGISSPSRCTARNEQARGDADCGDDGQGDEGHDPAMFGGQPVMGGVRGKDGGADGGADGAARRSR
jgi:hypothetical protein